MGLGGLASRSRDPSHELVSAGRVLSIRVLSAAADWMSAFSASRASSARAHRANSLRYPDRWEPSRPDFRLGSHAWLFNVFYLASCFIWRPTKLDFCLLPRLDFILSRFATRDVDRR